MAGETGFLKESEVFERKIFPRIAENSLRPTRRLGLKRKGKRVAGTKSR